jgi:hypothetical protein
MFATVKLLYGTGGGGKGKENDRESTILKKHNICAGRGYDNMY